MSILTATAPAANASFPPITRADLARAAMWKLKLPAAPMAVEPIPCPDEDLEDEGPAWTWDAWTDADIWELGPETPAGWSEIEADEVTALAADDEAACGPAMEWVEVTPFVSVLRSTAPTRIYWPREADGPRALIEAEGARPEAFEPYVPTRWEDDQAVALFARPSRRPARPVYTGTGITDEDLYRQGACS